MPTMMNPGIKAHQCSRFASDCIEFLEEQVNQKEPMGACLGLVEGQMRFTEMRDIPRLMDMEWARPRKQWWMELREIAQILAQPAPGVRTRITPNNSQ